MAPQPKVLAAASRNGSANAIAPVITRLALEDKVAVMTVADDHGIDVFDEQSIPYNLIGEYPGCTSSPSLDAMHRILREEQPDLVLTGAVAQDQKHRDVLEQTLTLAAMNERRIVLAVLDSWGNYLARFSEHWSQLSRHPHYEASIVDRFKYLPDYLGVTDEVAQQEMLDLGFPAERLAVTGNPHFDGLGAKARSFSDKRRFQLRQRIGLNAEVLFFYAGNAMSMNKEEIGYWDNDNLEVMTEALYMLNPKSAHPAVVVRPHPQTPENDLLKIMHSVRKAKPLMKLVYDIPAQELALAADMTLTASSTVGIEAVLMGRPCISLQPGLKGPDYLSFLTDKGIIPAGYTPEQCIGLIIAACDPDYRKHLAEKSTMFKTDGKATKRVTDLVYSLVLR